MDEQQQRLGRLKKEREEIAERVARFRATQAKFARERQEHFARTWRRVQNDEPALPSSRNTR